MTKKSKISVKHFLNKRLNAHDDKYWVYVRVIYKRKKLEFPSEYETYRTGYKGDATKADPVYALNEKEFGSIYNREFEKESIAIQNSIRYYQEVYDKNLLEESNPRKLLAQMTRRLDNFLSNIMMGELFDHMVENHTDLWSIIHFHNDQFSLSFSNIYEGLKNYMNVNGELVLNKKFHNYYELYKIISGVDIRLYEYLNSKDTRQSITKVLSKKPILIDSLFELMSLNSFKPRA